MAAKAILILCAQALLIQSAFSQCTSRATVDASRIAGPYGCAESLGIPGYAASGLAYDSFAAPYLGCGCAGRGLSYDGLYGPAMKFTATSSGALPVTSSSARAPTGISIVSDNTYEGILSVAGELPFVGTTGVDGILSTAGSGAVNYNCGNGLTVMSALSATASPASVATLAGPAFAAPGLAYDGLYAPGLACDGLASGLASSAFGYNGARLAGRGLAYDGLACASPIEAIEITPTSGGALPVSRAYAVSPTGVAVASDNAHEGALAVGAELPFLGTVGLKG